MPLESNQANKVWNLVRQPWNIGILPKAHALGCRYCLFNHFFNLWKREGFGGGGGSKSLTIELNISLKVFKESESPTAEMVVEADRSELPASVLGTRTAWTLPP